MNTKPIMMLASILVAIAALTACQKHDETSGGAGPAQKAGAQLDSAAGKAAEQLNHAGEKAGQVMQEAGKKLEDKSQDAQNQNQQQQK